MYLAPIVLFAYKRLEHTKSTINSLLLCDEAINSSIFIYSDAAKSKFDEIDVSNVRNYLKTVNGFKEVTIIYREVNFGLSANIIDALNQTFIYFNYAIILEDDIIVGPYFLKYMNLALSKYEHNKEVWHISGWNYPIINNDYKFNSYFLQVSNCWGWGTWSDRWKHFKKCPLELMNNWNKKNIDRFNIDKTNPNFWQQIKYNHFGKINTWAIFWYAIIFEHNGLCLNPTMTHTVNIGNDGSGENCDNNDIYKSSYCNNFQPNFPIDLSIEQVYFEQIKKFYTKNKISLFTRIKNRIISNLKFSK